MSTQPKVFRGSYLWLLPGEKVEMVLDSEYGVSPEPRATGEVLVLTNLRVVRRGMEEGRETVISSHLYRVEAAEVRHTDRSSQQLYLSTAAMTIGIFLAVGIWLLLDAPLLALLIGGVIASVGMWLSVGFLLAENTGHVCFFTSGQQVRIPLCNRLSIQAAYDVVNRFFELTQITTGQVAVQEADEVSAKTCVDQLADNGTIPQDSWPNSGHNVDEDIAIVEWPTKLDDRTGPHE